MDKHTQRIFLMVIAVMSLAIMIEVLLLVLGLDSLETLRQNLTLLIGTICIQFISVVYVLIQTEDEEKKSA